ncbi:hypothetical protein JB92DRAFT_3126258 [Gautieria morchelliformis]|nr:hypothetical protein JB92DRAFT_3126258 [Gautieria morchelliformis]
METQASNKTAHPGRVAKAPPHQTTAKVQEEHAAEVQAKAALIEAKKKGVNRAAEFERDDIAKEDLMDATACPPFTPKPWPPLHNHKAHHTPRADLKPIEESGGVEVTDDQSSFIPPNSEISVVGNSEVESAAAPSPAKKRKPETRKHAKPKATTTKKAMTTAKKSMVKSVGKKRAEESDVEMADSEAEPVKAPKPKKEMVQEQDKIDNTVKEIAEKELPGHK